MIKKIASVFVAVAVALGCFYGGFKFVEKKHGQLAAFASRTNLINKIIEKNKFKSYLEIGLNNPYANYAHVVALEKFSVDPYISNGLDFNNDENISKWLHYCTHRMTSNEFFKQNDRTYDVIFVDGMLSQEQIDLDIKNALNALNIGGYIILRGCKPKTEESQASPRKTLGLWFGDVWRSFYKAVQFHNPNLEIYLVDIDYGIGVIRKNGPVDYVVPEYVDISWEEYNKNLNNIVEIVEWKDIDKRI